MAELTMTDLRAAPVHARRVSPTQHLTEVFAAAEVAGSRAVRLREIPFLTMVGLSVEIGGGPAERVAAQLGTRLPTRCGAVATGDGCSVLWLAPADFLVVAVLDAAELTGTLVSALHGEPGSVVDLSANRTTLELTGPSSREVLEKGCSLDLHPRACVAGSAYVTSIASVPVVLWKTGAETFRVLPRSSFADHVGRWLVDAMAEFAVPEPTRWR